MIKKIYFKVLSNMFDTKRTEVYVYVPYKRKPNGDVLTDLQIRLNRGKRRTDIRPLPYRDVLARIVFNSRGYSSFSREISDSEAVMYSDGRLIRLNFLRRVYIHPNDLISPANFILADYPSRAILEHFSGSSEKDVAFVRQCLKDSRFRKEV